jgi:hypothetical protein
VIGTTLATDKMIAVNPKTRPNHQLYLRSLQRLGAAGRAAKVFELSDMAKRVFRGGLRRRFPDLAEPEFESLFLKQLARCHNRNY